MNLAIRRVPYKHLQPFTRAVRPSGRRSPMREHSSIVTTAYLGASSAIGRLKDEFWELMQAQEQALQDATYVGMTSETAKQCEKRRAEIAKICERIADLRSRQ